MTLTGSSLNCTNCVPIMVKIMLAKKDQTIEAKYKCMKAYYFRDLLGKCVRWSFLLTLF